MEGYEPAARGVMAEALKKGGKTLKNRMGQA
jgi:hypothetical protein